MFKVATKVDIDSLVKKALQLDDKRSRDIVLHRFGLKKPEKRTLASLGKELGLTRERVRQIEAAALKSIRERIKEEKQTLAFLELTEGYLKSVSKLRRSDLLAHDIAILCGIGGHTPIFENKLVFLAKVLGRPYIKDETQETHAIWHLDDEIHSMANQLVKRLLKYKEHDFDKYLEEITKEHQLPEPTVINYLSLSKNFDVGPYGHMGATHWVHVNPKTVRDKAYLALKQADGPLHFRDIARMVNEISEKERAHATVHNELIRDPRFVLQGRGTYMLDE